MLFLCGLMTILTRRNTDDQIESLTDRDIFIKPDLGEIETASFDRAGEAIPTGVAAAETVGDRLTQLSLSAEDYRSHMAARKQREALGFKPMQEADFLHEGRLKYVSSCMSAMALVAIGLSVSVIVLTSSTREATRGEVCVCMGV